MSKSPIGTSLCAIWKAAPRRLSDFWRKIFIHNKSVTTPIARKFNNNKGAIFQVRQAPSAFFLLAVVLLLPAIGRAQSLDLSGYLEHQYTLTRQKDEWVHLDHDRLRLDLNATAGKRTRASAGIIWQLYRGDTTINLARQLPPAIAERTGNLTTTLSNRSFLNHAYVSFRPGPVEVVVGKQYMTWGAAWVFNPTELFRPKNVFEPSYDREGVGALVVKIPLGPLSDLLVGLVPNGSLSESGKVARVRIPIGSWDASAVAAYLTENSVPFNVAGSDGNAGRITVGGDLTGEIGNFGIWVEGTFSDRAEEQWIEATLGGNHSLADGTLFLVEVLYNGRGAWNAPYEAGAWIGRLTGDTRTLGRLTSYAMVSRQVGQLWNLAGSLIANPGDGSAVFVPSISYDFAENVELTFIGLAHLGEVNDEYGRDQYGGYVRGRVYF